MYRLVMLVLALTFVPAVVTAQQPCTTDARHVVNELYRHMLERQADPGSAHWVQQLENGQMTVRDVVREIATSQEYTQRFVRTEPGEATPYERSVARLYRHILGRQPDAEGQRAFAQIAQSSGARAVIERIVRSREYNQQFGDWGVPGSGGVVFCAPGTARSQTSAQTGASASRRFRNMDRNNDGVVSRSEWRGSPRSFNVHDWNGDGVLSDNEVDAAAARAGRTLEDMEFDRDEEFEYLDVNNNGRIEPREWHGSVAAFNRLDANNDNRLTRAEFGTFGGARVAPTSGTRISVDARERWVDTGLTVQRGELITFNASGQVRLSADGNDVARPAGALSGRHAAQAPLPSNLAGALIGRIGATEFAIGNQPSIRAPASGRLYLSVNDDHLADNEGAFEVFIDVR
jgi:Ca2+-binding EF-hand superfamily protein